MNIRKEYNRKKELVDKYKELGYNIPDLEVLDKNLVKEYNNMSKLEENKVIQTAIQEPKLIENTTSLAKKSGVPKEVVEQTLRKTNFEEILEEHNLGKENLANDMELFRQKMMSEMSDGSASNRDLINWFALLGKFNGADRQQIDVSLEDKGDIFDIINKNIANLKNNE